MRDSRFSWFLLRLIVSLIAGSISYHVVATLAWAIIGVFAVNYLLAVIAGIAAFWYVFTHFYRWV